MGVHQVGCVTRNLIECTFDITEREGEVLKFSQRYQKYTRTMTNGEIEVENIVEGKEGYKVRVT